MTLGNLYFTILDVNTRAGLSANGGQIGVGMENIVYHGVAVGGKIYSLRMAKRMTQEQLAEILRISPAAVSKWERNLSVPSVEMLWALSDFFDCSIDELVGRSLAQVERVGAYDDETFRLAVVGEDLLKCSQVSRAEGLLAMEEGIPNLKGECRFLAFSISYIMNLYRKQMPPEQAFELLGNYVYTLPEKERAEGRMVAAVLRKIFDGECPELIQELIASHIGMDYRERSGYMKETLKYTRQELISQHKDKKMYSEATCLLEEMVHLGDFEIQVILRNLDNVTLTRALAGASGGVVTAFMSNLSDRVLYLLSEDLEHWEGSEEDILTAQRTMLEVGDFCLSQMEEKGEIPVP